MNILCTEQAIQYCTQNSYTILRITATLPHRNSAIYSVVQKSEASANFCFCLWNAL